MKYDFYALYVGGDWVESRTLRTAKANNIVPGRAYKVVDFSMGQSTSNIVIITEDGRRVPFNSVGFSFYKIINGNIVDYDPYSDPEINPYLPQR